MTTVVEEYHILEELGEGSYGSVWRAMEKHTGEMVAIKLLKKRFSSLDECLNLREVKSLLKLNHPNIVRLKRLMMESGVWFFIFESMECNLHQLVKIRLSANFAFLEDEIRHYSFQLFQALAHMHQKGYFHRDLKPENLLVSGAVIKVADLGMAREVSPGAPLTQRVTTRWYRAPEVLLLSTSYGPAIDMWAMGVIMAELFTSRPLFPGSNSVDQIYKICNVIGSPNKETWGEGVRRAEELNFKFPEIAGSDLSRVIPNNASEDAIDLIGKLCSWDPSKRPTAVEALQHPFFKLCIEEKVEEGVLMEQQARDSACLLKFMGV